MVARVEVEVGVQLLVLTTGSSVASKVSGVVGWVGWYVVLRTFVRLSSFWFGLFVTLGVKADAIAAREAVGVL